MNQLKVIAASQTEAIMLRRFRGAPVSETHAALIDDEYDRISFYEDIYLEKALAWPSSEFAG